MVNPRQFARQRGDFPETSDSLRPGGITVNRRNRGKWEAARGALNSGGDQGFVHQLHCQDWLRWTGPCWGGGSGFECSSACHEIRKLRAIPCQNHNRSFTTENTEELQRSQTVVPWLKESICSPVCTMRDGQTEPQASWCPVRIDSERGGCILSDGPLCKSVPHGNSGFENCLQASEQAVDFQLGFLVQFP